MKKRIWRAVAAYVFNSAGFVFVLSEDFKEKLIKIGVSENKILVTTTFFHKNNIFKKVDNENKAAIPGLVFLGRLSEIKGIDDMLHALSEVKLEGYDFQCKVIGHGDAPGVVEKYEELSKELNIDDCVHFLGRKTGEEKFLLLTQSDVFVFPSHMEGCPTSVIEALATGLFVVSSDVGALKDLINKDNGLTVRAKDRQALASAIRVSLCNIDNIRCSHENISKFAHEKYEVGTVSENFICAYRKLMSS